MTHDQIAKRLQAIRELTFKASDAILKAKTLMQDGKTRSATSAEELAHSMMISLDKATTALVRDYEGRSA